MKILNCRRKYYEAIPKIGFWFKIPTSPKGFDGTSATGPSFKPQAYLLYVDDLKRGTNPAEKGGKPKDIFEMLHIQF